MEAVVLAGGFGTRLAALVPDLPKPMAPVCGRPFLELLLGALRAKGVRRAVLSLGYRAPLIRDHFGDRFGDLALAYEVEHSPLGTGGAIRRALARCQGDAALVVNGDTLLDLELDALRAQWEHQRRPLLVCCQVDDCARYGRIDSVDGHLTGFVEKGGGGPGWINSGHYVLPRTLFDGWSLPEAFSFESDFVAPNLSALHFEVFRSNGSFIDIGVPEDYRRAQTELARWAARRALFLDRDGVINVDHGYVHRVDQFEFLPGIFDLVRTARSLALLPVVVTNQAGIGRGLYTEADFQAITTWMLERFAEHGAALERVYHCPTHPDAAIGAYRVDSPLRKPGPGMLLLARDELGLDLARSALLGDKASDIAAGRAAGVGLELLLQQPGIGGERLPAGAEVVTSLPQADARLRRWVASLPPSAG